MLYCVFDRFVLLHKSPIFAWFRWASVVVWFSGRTVRSTNELTRNRMANPQENHGEKWIKTANIGDLWSRTKRSKTQYNISAGKEIILLIY